MSVTNNNIGSVVQYHEMKKSFTFGTWLYFLIAAIKLTFFGYLSTGNKRILGKVKNSQYQERFNIYHNN